ncbi:Anaphase-promoting complex subunit 6 [Capsicum annuum]|nr:Anaphase-promoting complex subunit 6 [Capsicum annuum]
MREEDIERLRGVVRDCVSKHLYSSAIFFADKVAAITSDPADIYMQAQALYLGRHYRRAFHLLNASQIVLRDLRFRYLAAKCLVQPPGFDMIWNDEYGCGLITCIALKVHQTIVLVFAFAFDNIAAYIAKEELKEWDQCLLMLGDAKVDEHGNITDTRECNSMYLDKDGEDREINILSAICFLRGKAYEALENHAQARLWYKAAIKADPLCYEALECLIENHMLTCDEGENLFWSSGPPWNYVQLDAEHCLGSMHYDKENVVEAKFRELEQSEPNTKFSDKSVLCTLKANTDLLACKAEYYHQCGEYQKCFELTSELLEKDPFHLKCTLVHLAAAMELGHSNELYLMACNLVKDYPQKALSWFAVGCYYYCIKKYDQARRYFSKATSLDGTFASAWIGYGNAYAAQEEGDHAMSAYRTAARLFPGCERTMEACKMENAILVISATTATRGRVMRTRSTSPCCTTWRWPCYGGNERSLRRKRSFAPSTHRSNFKWSSGGLFFPTMSSTGVESDKQHTCIREGVHHSHASDSQPHLIEEDMFHFMVGLQN